MNATAKLALGLVALAFVVLLAMQALPDRASGDAVAAPSEDSVSLPVEERSSEPSTSPSPDNRESTDDSGFAGESFVDDFAVAGEGAVPVRAGAGDAAPVPSEPAPQRSGASPVPGAPAAGSFAPGQPTVDPSPTVN